MKELRWVYYQQEPGAEISAACKPEFDVSESRDPCNCSQHDEHEENGAGIRRSCGGNGGFSGAQSADG